MLQLFEYEVQIGHRLCSPLLYHPESSPALTEDASLSIIFRLKCYKWMSVLTSFALVEVGKLMHKDHNHLLANFEHSGHSQLQ